MPLQTVAPQRLYRQIAEQLRVLIGNGEFAIGTRLPAERELAKQLGVSRPSVREALIALEVDAWVEVRSGSGVYVKDRSATQAVTAGKLQKAAPAEWGPLELIRARRIVEGETAAIAATEAKRKDTQVMAAAIAAMRADADTGTMPLEGDRAFHTAIVEACGNGVLLETVQSYWDSRRSPVFERLVGYFETVDSWRTAIVEHEAIYNAIRSHDASAARAAMHTHLDNSHTRFSASWRRAKKLESHGQHP